MCKNRACLIGYGTEQHNAVTVHVIFFITFLYFLPPINIKTLIFFFHFVYHINNFLLLFK
jgi:hypothetical protein